MKIYLNWQIFRKWMYYSVCTCIRYGIFISDTTTNLHFGFPVLFPFFSCSFLHILHQGPHNHRSSAVADYITWHNTCTFNPYWGEGGGSCRILMILPNQRVKFNWNILNLLNESTTSDVSIKKISKIQSPYQSKNYVFVHEIFRLHHSSNRPFLNPEVYLHY